MYNGELIQHRVYVSGKADDAGVVASSNGWL